ncbi:MAG: ATP-binding cassette domain-containing protein [Dinoroseobacter sp.]|nr:ATP-binding cassette domain-containing protein [Dinoroseobacter sp.]
MAHPPLLQLSGIRLGFGGDPVFEDLDLVIQPGDRVALVGRNGSGKSTLMKVMAGLVEADEGQRTTAPSTSVGYMQQEPDLSGFPTLGDFAASDLPPEDAWRIEMAAEGLKLKPDTSTEKASGGERRRAALVKLLAEAPELMLLDEPTNHLDIEAIGWLEAHLTDAQAAYVLISHDRTFLSKLTRATLWIDRGAVRRQDRGFAEFEAWRDKVWEEEDVARHKLDRKIKAEARWAVEGISARRKRNMGRVRALGELRKNREEMIRRPDTAAMTLDAGTQSGKRVIEAKGISKSFDDRIILKPFDLRVLRGDRVAFVGPNGVGKTTVLKMLTGELAPDTGTVTHGTNLELAVFDQNRAQLDPDLSLWDSLTGDPSMRVSGRADQVMVRGTPRHVVGYLKDFLFNENQARSPVRSLSGGESARLLLARIMARESNLLVLDEPTNDLDIETLDLLQEVLSDYPGTVLLVSHDRDFIDRVATSTVAMEGDGRAVVYAGGWSDYQAQRKEVPAAPSKPTPSPKAVSKPAKQAKATPSASEGLSFTEAHRLKELPGQIERLEAEIAKLEAFLSDPELFTKEPAKFQKASEALVERQAALSAAEEDWLTLEDKAASAT